MPSALSIIGAATLIFIGWAGDMAYEHHPPLSWHAHVLFWRPGIDIPGGPLVVANAQRDEALKASRVAQDGQKLCDASLTEQNASMARASALGAKALITAQTALNATRKQNTKLTSGAMSLRTLTLTSGATTCQHWDQADAAVKVALEGVK